MSPCRNLRNAHRQDFNAHVLPLLELVQLPVEVELKVHDLVRRERDDDLALVGRAREDGLAGPDLPLVDALVGEDMPNSSRVDLKKGVVAELLDAERGRGGDEARVGDFFDRVANRENEGAVDEREDDVGVVLV